MDVNEIPEFCERLKTEVMKRSVTCDAIDLMDHQRTIQATFTDENLGQRVIYFSNERTVSHADIPDMATRIARAVNERCARG